MAPTQIFLEKTMTTSFYSDWVDWAEKEQQGKKIKLKQFLIIHIRNSEENPIQTSSFKIESLDMSSKTLKFRTPHIPFGTKQHIIVHKLAEKGFHHGFMVNNIDEIKNPLTCEIPFIYMQNGELKTHYTWERKGEAGLTASEHYFEIKFQKISAYFIRGGQIQFDGDKFAPKDPNLKQLGMQIEAIGFDNM